jgi:hypothetical protein
MLDYLLNLAVCTLKTHSHIHHGKMDNSRVRNERMLEEFDIKKGSALLFFSFLILSPFHQDASDT